MAHKTSLEVNVMFVAAAIILAVEAGSAMYWLTCIVSFLLQALGDWMSFF